MVDGGENIKEATWESVSSMLQVVSNHHGTALHTSNANTVAPLETVLSSVDFCLNTVK